MPSLIPLLALAAVVIAGGSLLRKGKITRSTYMTIIGIMAIAVIATIALQITAERGTSGRSAATPLAQVPGA